MRRQPDAVFRINAGALSADSFNFSYQIFRSLCGEPILLGGSQKQDLAPIRQPLQLPGANLAVLPEHSRFADKRRDRRLVRGLSLSKEMPRQIHMRAGVSAGGEKL